MNCNRHAHVYTKYCLCQTDFCKQIQSLLVQHRPEEFNHDGEAEWCHPGVPLTISFHSSTSDYTTWLLILSICYHIPVFLDTFLEAMGDDLDLRTPQPHMPTKKWVINRCHFPVTLLSPRLRERFDLLTRTKPLSPGIAKQMEVWESQRVHVGAVEARIPMTSIVNTVGYLEDYAERILPANLFQEFLHAKRKPKCLVPDRDFFVQAPGVSCGEVVRFCSLLKIPQTAVMDTIINMAPTPPSQSIFPSLPTTTHQEEPQEGLVLGRRLATIQRGVGRPVDVVFDDGSNDLPTTGISIPLRNGSQLTIYPRMVETEEAMKLTDEIMSRPHLFHQYRVQGFNKERRLQGQFHHKATDDFEATQPGYRYNNQTTLKARPISSIPSLKRLADRLKPLCKVPSWNIGATIVIYRNGRDKMGQHRGTYRLDDH
jgi:hypothetical protein